MTGYFNLVSLLRLQVRTNLNTDAAIFVTSMIPYRILDNLSFDVYANQIRNWIMLTSITISVLYLILSTAGAVTAQSGDSNDQEFLSKFVELTNKSGDLTNSYQQEIGKWKNNEYSNTTIIMITNDTLTQINNLIDETNNLQIPEKFKGGVSLYTKSLEAERDSYKQFGDFIKTGNPALNETSTDLLSDSFKYEIEAFKAIQSPQQ